MYSAAHLSVIGQLSSVITKFYLSDLKKPIPEMKKRELKKVTTEMIEEGTLMYYSTGSTTMLQLPEDDVDAGVKE